MQQSRRKFLYSSKSANFLPILQQANGKFFQNDWNFKMKKLLQGGVTLGIYLFVGYQVIGLLILLNNLDLLVEVFQTTRQITEDYLK